MRTSWRKLGMTAALGLVLTLVAIGVGLDDREPAFAAEVQGDADCDGGVTTRDNQALLRFVLEQPALSQTEPCTDIGTDGWGDWDCDGELGSRDGQAVLRFTLEQAALSQTEPCPDIGAELTEPQNSYELIDAAVEAGTLGVGQGILYKAYAAYGDPQLPPAYASDVPVEGPPVEILERPSGLSAEVNAELDSYLLDPWEDGSWFENLYGEAVLVEEELAAAGASPTLVPSVTPTLAPTPTFDPVFEFVLTPGSSPNGRVRAASLSGRPGYGDVAEAAGAKQSECGTSTRRCCCAIRLTQS